MFIADRWASETNFSDASFRYCSMTPALTIGRNWRREDGSIATTQLGTLDRGACRSA
jgi:hypothetical protein